MRKKYILSSEFSTVLINWYQQNKRNLPWRLTNNPYFIWLSEIILQQTRVDQGLPYYNRFIDKFPTVASLASAPEDEVLKLWQGLGYYSRARNLHNAAQYIVLYHQGVFPSAHKDVIALKGVGEYTSAAIMSFAYNKPYAAVDGNVYRLLSRYFGVDEYIDTGKGKKLFLELATELLDKDDPGTFNQATMEFGAMQCVPSSPNCQECPFVDSCFAYNNNVIAVLPRKQGKVVTRNRYFNYIDIRIGDNLFLNRREAGDIWEGLYEFPLIETEKEMSFEELCKTVGYINLELKGNETILKKYSFKHVLSHQVIYATFYQVGVDSFKNSSFLSTVDSELDKYAVSRLTHKYLESI